MICCESKNNPGESLGGREGERERGRERGSEGARERGSEGARERGSEGARERGSEGARERGRVCWYIADIWRVLNNGCSRGILLCLLIAADFVVLYCNYCYFINAIIVIDNNKRIVLLS